jgi:hypothetical protein
MCKVYIFQADIYCEACGEAMRADAILGGPDELPQGPFTCDEADTPLHCGACGEFLESPLTSDGLAYAREAVAMRPRHGVAARVWAPFYGIEVFEVRERRHPGNPAGPFWSRRDAESWRDAQRAAFPGARYRVVQLNK